MKKNLTSSILVISISAFFLISCGTTVGKLMGYYTSPRWLTTPDIKNIAKKDSAYYDAFYYIPNIKNWLALSQKNLVEFPGVYLFDKNLNPVRSFSGSDCAHEALRFITALDETSQKNVMIDTSMHTSAKEFLSYTKLIEGNPDIIKEGSSQFDYLFVYTWASYTPKFTKELFESSAKIKNNTALNIKVISLNEDFMAEWNENPQKVAGKKVKMNNFDNYHFIP